MRCPLDFRPVSLQKQGLLPVAMERPNCVYPPHEKAKMTMHTTKEADLDRVIRPREIAVVTGLSLATIWRREKVGDFPRRRQISPGAVGWLASEVQAWLSDREPTVSEVPLCTETNTRGWKPAAWKWR